MENKEKVLVVGAKSGIEVSKLGYPDIEPDYQAGASLRTRKTNYYDAVICYHNLQLLEQNKVVDYLVSLARTMKERATINLFVPALEWAAEQIVFEENPSPILIAHLFGANQVHRSGHTLRSLRRDLALAGFAVTHASDGLYVMEVQQGGTFGEIEAGQHVVIGYKREDEDNEPYKTLRE